MEVSKLDKSINFKLEHPSNILAILVIFALSKTDKSTDSSFEHPWNNKTKLSIDEVSIFPKLIFFNSEQP